MGGSDSVDQRMESNRPELKTISWIPRVLTHFHRREQLYLAQGMLPGAAPNSLRLSGRFSG